MELPSLIQLKQKCVGILCLVGGGKKVEITSIDLNNDAQVSKWTHEFPEIIYEV